MPDGFRAAPPAAQRPAARRSVTRASKWAELRSSGAPFPTTTRPRGQWDLSAGRGSVPRNARSCFALQRYPGRVSRSLLRHLPANHRPHLARRFSRSLARSTSHTPPSPPFERAAASRAKRPRSGTRGARRRRRTSRAERAGSQPRGARCSQPRGARCLPARRAQHRALLSRLPLRSAPNALAPQALTRGTARPSRTPSSTSTSSRGRVRAAGKRDGS